jgi:predicted ATPase/DNA-binding CsgD family transcriptional regulator
MHPQTLQSVKNGSKSPTYSLDNRDNPGSRLYRVERESLRQLFQLVGGFKETRNVPTPPNNLPLQATAIVGREREIMDCVALLRREDLSLLTLTGTAGTGKTRLAHQVAHELLGDFEDGTFFVSLNSITDPALVATTIAMTLGIKDLGGKPVLQLLKDWLSHRRVLLVLDNFEQVVAAAPLLTEVLMVAPGLKIMVTSREVLRVYGEREYAVTPLTVPDIKELPSLEQLAENGAVTLFVHRARSVKPDFNLNESNALAIAEICSRLDGLPLAIELAAARSKLFTPQALLARLCNRLDLLVGNMRDIPQRQQKLRSAFDWSYDLLDPAEKTLFVWLAVFVKGFTIEAAETVCGALPGHPGFDNAAMLDILSSLVDKSMLQLVTAKDSEPRFVMLGTLREYAQERLNNSPEAEILRLRHAEYFLGLAEKAEPALIGPDQNTWVEQLDREHSNFRAALTWLLENQAIEVTETGAQAGIPTRFLEMAARLAGALARFWHIRNHATESLRGFEVVLAKITNRNNLPLPVMRKTLCGAAAMAYIKGDYPQSLAWYEEALELNRAGGDSLGVATVLRDMGLVLAYAGNCDRALELFEEAMTVQQQLNDRWGLGVTLLNRGLAGIGADNLALARESLDSALKLFTELKETRGSSYVLNNLGYVAIFRGELASATEYLLNSLKLKQTLNDRLGIAWSLDGLAAITARQGHAEKAAWFLGAAAKLRELVSSPLTYFGHKLNNPTIALVRASLDEASFRQAQARGYALTMDEMLAEAFSLEPAIDTKKPGKPPVQKSVVVATLVPGTRNAASLTEDILPKPRNSSLKLIDQLTSREIEVLRTVALGLSNQQVAEKLVIAPRTVNVHLTSIYGKLGVTSRTEATRFAFENNLV